MALIYIIPRNGNQDEPFLEQHDQNYFSPSILTIIKQISKRQKQTTNLSTTRYYAVLYAQFGDLAAIYLSGE